MKVTRFCKISKLFKLRVTIREIEFESQSGYCRLT